MERMAPHGRRSVSIIHGRNRRLRMCVHSRLCVCQLAGRRSRTARGETSGRFWRYYWLRVGSPAPPAIVASATILPYNSDCISRILRNHLTANTPNRGTTYVYDAPLDPVDELL